MRFTVFTSKGVKRQIFGTEVVEPLKREFIYGEFKHEGREGVKWELGFAFFRGWEMEFCALGLGFTKKKQ